MLRYVGLLVVGLVGCTVHTRTDPLCGRTGPQAEALAGDRLAPKVEAGFGGRVHNVDAENRMALVTQRLARAGSDLKGPYRCYLLASPRLNAISLPGGRLYITSGLYDRITTEAQLAAILAHEMSHLATKDCFKPKCISSAESLRREMDADTRAAAYLSAVGYDPAVMATVFQLIEHEQPSGWTAIRTRNITEQYASPARTNQLASATTLD